MRTEHLEQAELTLTLTLRVGWATDEAEINAGIDEMSADGKTSISAGLEAARQLFNDSRVGATKVVLLVADGER